MQAGIAIIVLGAIGLVVFAAVSPTLFGSFGDTFQQTQAACVRNGERFTAVNTAEDWTGTDHALSKDATTTACDGVTKKGVAAGSAGTSRTGATLTYYTPHGQTVSVAGVTSTAAAATPDDTAAPLPGGTWEPALMIMTEQGGINRLVITILPLLTVIGAIALLYSWHKSRQTA